MFSSNLITRARDQWRSTSRQLTVSNPAQALDLAPVPCQPTWMRETPAPPRKLVPKPALPGRESQCPELGRHQHRTEQEEHPHRVGREHEDDAIALDQILLLG